VTIERHLMLQELTLRPSGEWAPRHYEWFILRVVEGNAYWLQPGSAPRQLGAGDGLLTAGNSNGVLRASQLSELKLQFFIVQPQFLNGLLTVAEWHQLEVIPQSPAAPALLFTAGQPLAQRFTRLAEQPRREGLPMRCGLLLLWANAIADLLPAPAADSTGSNKLRERFRQLVGRMPEAELSQCSLRDLAGQLNCSERHFTRLFREAFGVPFRARQIELRLQRARQLLADSNAKIINVAYDSGYQHLGLFNMMFKKRFGMTPSEWRQQCLRRRQPASAASPLPTSTKRFGVLLVLLSLILLPLHTSVAAPGFNVRTYSVVGSRLPDTNTLAGIFARHIGTDVSVEELGEAAADLQKEYSRQGYTAMSFAIAPQQITNGDVTINVFEAAAPQILVAGTPWFSSGKITLVVPKPVVSEPAVPAPPMLAAATNAAPPAIIPLAGPASSEEISQARTALMARLAELKAEAADTRIHVPDTNAGPRFSVNKYLVTGNTALTPDVVAGAFTNVDGAFGTNVSLDGVRAGLTELQAAYRDHGFVTVSVGLPPQKVTNATVKVQVTEGRLVAINVAGHDWHHYYNSNNVMRALPSLQTNELLNSHVLQGELDAANANRNRQIYPVVGPGPEPGTSELTLNVKDRLPLHARLELNNQGTPGTPDLRFNFSSQYDNLWGLEHQVGVQYGFSPETMKNEDDFVNSPFDEPLVANYSAYYRLPLGGVPSVQQEIQANPGSFGYNEATHRFNLPPSTGRPELNFYVSRSTSDTGVQRGPRTNVVTTPLLTIDSQDSGDNVTLNEGSGFRFSLPLPQLAAVSSTLSLGADYKRYQLSSYNTNNFFVTEVVTNSAGQPVVIQQNVASGQPKRSATLIYVPLNVGLNGSIVDSLGTTFFNSQANFNLPWVFSDDADFGKASYTTNAKAGYITLQMGMDRVQTIYGDWTVKLHADGQWANGPLISNEQMAMGGIAGVRGYQDGFAYGDEGWRISIEPQTPLFKIGMVGNEGHAEPCWLRGSAFLDYGRLYDLDVPSGFDDTINFCGIGFGLSVNIGTHLDGRLSVGWPLISHSGLTSEGTRIYFGVGAQF